VASVSTKPDPVFDAFAAREPYFAVVTDPRFLRANLTAAHEREFFATGEALVDRLFAIIEAGLVPGFAPVSMLEYGCGLGRLAIPLSRRPGSVTAIDRSPVMLELARREAERRGAGHIAFETPDAFQATSRKFDLVICYHVLQRLPRHREPRHRVRSSAPKQCREDLRSPVGDRRLPHRDGRQSIDAW